MGENAVVELIVTAVAEYEARKFGAIQGDEASVAVFKAMVDRKRIIPLCYYLKLNPHLSATKVVETFTSMIPGESWLSSPDPTPSPASSPEPTSAPVLKPAPEQDPLPSPAKVVEPMVSRLDTEGGREVEGTLLDVMDADDPSSQVRALGGPIPKNLDNHSPLIIGTGLFRALNKNAQNPMLRPILDSSVVHEVDPRIMVGYSCMTLAGPVLDTALDIKTYLCLIRVLGSMDPLAYQHATTTPILMQPEDFYSPLAEVVSPEEFEAYKRDFIETGKIIPSLKRIHSFQMTLFGDRRDAVRSAAGEVDFKRLGPVMVVGLVSAIELDERGRICITPNLAMRNMYQEASRLIAINRFTVMGFKYSLSPAFAFWLTTLGKGRFDKRWVYVDKRLTVKEILEAIHPIPAGNYYKLNNVKMLESVLIELVECGVLECGTRTHKSGPFVPLTPENCASFSLGGLKTQVELIRHKLSHKDALSKPAKPRAMIPSAPAPEQVAKKGADLLNRESMPSAIPLHNEIVRILKSVNFKGARSYKHSRDASIEKLVMLHQEDLVRVVSLIRTLEMLDPQMCKKSLLSVGHYRRPLLADLFNAALDEQGAAFLSEVCARYWLSVKDTVQVSNELYQILNTMPTASNIKDPGAWATTYAGQISAFLALMMTDAGAQLLRSMKLSMVKARLIQPLTNAKMVREAKRVQGRMDMVR